MPIWLLLLAFLRFCRGQWRDALRHLAILPFGAAIAFAGLKAGDLVAVSTYGPLLKSQVSAVDRGAAPAQSNGLSSSSTMAFKLTGGFLDIAKGILYDSTGQAGQMLAIPPAARPVDWQKNAVDVVSCEGSTSSIRDFFLVTVSTSSC